MHIREYPEDIKRDIKLYDPYRLNIKKGVLKDAPPEAIAAFERVKKWAWEQEQ